MKKVLCEVIFVMTFVLGMTVMALGATYRYTGTADFTSSFTKTYRSGNISFEYKPGNGWIVGTTYGKTRAGEYTTLNAYVYTSSTIVAVNNSSDAEDRGGKNTSGGWWYSSYASVSGQRYAKSASFYADVRSDSNTITDAYYYTVN